MKKIKIVLSSIIILGTLSITSCKDAIDIVQDGEVNESVAFQNVSDLRSFLNGSVYSTVNTTDEIHLTSLITDESSLPLVNTGFYNEEYRFILTSSNSQVASMWLTHYTTINRVNRLLEEAVKINPAENPVEYKAVLAEARALRAFAYISLYPYFTTNMEDGNALGVMLVKDVPLVDVKPPRVKNSEIWALIDEDLAYADANFASNNLTSYKFITKNALNAMRARYYNYRNLPALASQYANAAIAAGPALTPAASYRSMWQDAIQGENIFVLSRPSVGGWRNIASLWTTNTSSSSGTVQISMGFNLFNLMADSDIRKSVFVDPTSTSVLKVIDKYPGKNNTPLRNDIKVFRTSEMVLIAAEAAIAQNNLSQASTLINQVRTARFAVPSPAPTPVPVPPTPVVYANQAEAYRDLLKERRIELCFEGHRFLDLKRLGKKAGVSIDRNVKDDQKNTGTPLTLSIDDYRWTWPIPNAEISGNSAIVQNPGY